MHRALSLATLFAALSAPAAAYSGAAEYLINEQIGEACEGGAGQIDPAAAIERDLTGDGRADFILSHEGISCAGGGQSRFCGQLCRVAIYVRRGDLLHPQRDMLGRGVRVGGGDVPTIQMYGLGGTPAALQWNGQDFGPAN